MRAVARVEAFASALEEGFEDLKPGSDRFAAAERLFALSAKTLTELHKLGLPGARLRNDQVELALHAIRAAPDALDLTADQRRRAQDGAAAALRSGRGT